MEEATSDQFIQQLQDSNTTECGMSFLKTGSKASITGSSFQAQNTNQSWTDTTVQWAEVCLRGSTEVGCEHKILTDGFSGIAGNLVLYKVNVLFLDLINIFFSYIRFKTVVLFIQFLWKQIHRLFKSRSS